MRQIKLWSAVLVAGLLLMGSLLACVQPGRQSQPLDRKQEFLQLHAEMKDYIGKARAAAVELEDSSWGDLADIGLESPPAGLCGLGACVIKKESAVDNSTNLWTPLVDMLPRAESARPLKIYCDKSLEMSVKVRTQRPTSDNITPEAAEEDPEVAQWQDQCHQLESTLRGGETLARNYLTTAQNSFKKLDESFEKSDDKVKKQYLAKFQKRCTEYTNLLDEMIRNLQYARSSLAEMAGWEDYAVGIEERTGTGKERKVY